MKKRALAALLAILAFGATSMRAQEKARSEGTKSDPATQQITPLRVVVVFTEYDGDKKVSSLPYTVLVNADDKGPQAAVRMGLRVPVVSGGPVSPNANKQFQYVDVGTNLDGHAEKIEDGRFNLRLSVEKSSLYTPGAAEKADAGGNQVLPGEPVIQQFRSQVNLLLRDGQTMQSTVASDPISGHVLKVDVTLNVIK